MQLMAQLQIIAVVQSEQRRIQFLVLKAELHLTTLILQIQEQSIQLTQAQILYYFIRTLQIVLLLTMQVVTYIMKVLLQLLLLVRLQL